MPVASDPCSHLARRAVSTASWERVWKWHDFGAWLCRSDAVVGMGLRYVVLAGRLPLPGKLPVYAAFNRHVTRTRAELEVIVVQQVLADDGELEMARGLPAEAQVHFDIVGDIQIRQLVDIASDHVKIPVAAKVPGRAQVNLIMRVASFIRFAALTEARFSVLLHLEKRVLPSQLPVVGQLQGSCQPSTLPPPAAQHFVQEAFIIGFAMRKALSILDAAFRCQFFDTRANHTYQRSPPANFRL